MRYREIKPTPPLRSFVECFWTLEGDGLINGAPPERILPDGCVELILNFGDRFLQHVGGEKRRQPRNFIVGQMTGPIVISASGVVRLLGIRFQPGGTRPFIDLPANEITDRVVALEDLSRRFERSLLRVCESAVNLDQKIFAVDEYLVSRLKDGKFDPHLLALAANVIDRRGLVSVDQLAAYAGVSSRQLERRFLQEVGLGPKLLARIVRFQQVFRAVESNPAWAEVAVECGYYDQAHLIRDFNQFAQQTPAVLFASQSLLTESFTRKTR
ncbi:MAG TPA: helix-turn-helix domain-containing protein [Pyrinomonadaceae bacterium]|nr:helix-turn-helix domain-containing protein [Pyrinomonadaceae bacterium]